MPVPAGYVSRTRLPRSGVMLASRLPHPGVVRAGSFLAGTSDFDARLDILEAAAPKLIAPGVAGITGDGATDDTDAIAAQIAAAGVGGTVEWRKPTSYYRTTDSLTPLDYQAWWGNGWLAASTAGAWVRGNGTFPVIEALSAVSHFTLQGLSFSGGGAVSGSKGLYAAEANFWHVRDCLFSNFGDQAVHIAGGTAGTYDRLYADASMLVRSGRTEYVGVIDINAHDATLSGIEASASFSSLESVWIAGIVLRSVNGFMDTCVGEEAAAGIVLVSGGAQWTLMGNRADINWGHGYILEGSESVLIGNRAYRNGRAADDTYDGFQVNNHGHVIIGNSVGGLVGDANKQRYGFLDQASGFAGADYGNRYDANKATNIRRTLYATGSSNKAGFADVDRSLQRTVTSATTLTYADQTVLGNAAGGAFTVTLPTAAGVTGKRFTIKRTSASNNVTIDGDSAETIDGAATKVLGSQYATVVIESDGTNWVVVSQMGTVT